MENSQSQVFKRNHPIPYYMLTGVAGFCIIGIYVFAAPALVSLVVSLLVDDICHITNLWITLPAEIVPSSILAAWCAVMFWKKLKRQCD